MTTKRAIRFAFPLVALLLATCTSGVTPTATSRPGGVAGSIPPSASAVPTSPTRLPLTFRASASQARMVATLVAFLDAYDAGHVDAALALIPGRDVAISDCDYRAISVIMAQGPDAVRQWLAERAADHDQLILESIVNENPDPTTGSHVVAVSYTRRTSDTLRSLGFRDGITPETATKVVFTATDDRIRAFANGGTRELCRPK